MSPAQHGQRTNERLAQSSKIEWVRLSDMQVNPAIQRERLDVARVEMICRLFDPDSYHLLALNKRDGVYWVVDGWHRMEAGIRVLGADQRVQAKVRYDLTDAEAAKWAIQLNYHKKWSPLDHFKAALTAGQPDESAINLVLKQHNLTVGRSKDPGVIGCVSTLQRIYERAGIEVLSRTLSILSAAYGDNGYDRSAIDGVALVVQRFGPQLDDHSAAARLGAARGGVDGLLGKARALHKQHLGNLAQCVAGAVVDIVNQGHRTGRLPVWWKA